MLFRAVAALLWIVGGLASAANSGSSAVQPAARQHVAAAGERSARMRERAQLLRLGEASLAKGAVEEALHAFDGAAQILHAADTEMGLVRTYMQGGEYRRALAFAAHTAQAHRENPGGAVLHAWLLAIGGQGVNSKRVLSEAEMHFPKNAFLAAARRQLDSRAPVASGALLSAPARMAPFGYLPGVPGSARVAGSGVLVDGGKRAVVPLAITDNAATLWVRNALGLGSRATVEHRMIDAGIAIVKLDTPIHIAAELAIAPADPFPGSVAFAVEYVATTTGNPAWPLLSSGFIGQPTQDGAHQALGIELPAGPHGGPVFDIAGRFSGIALLHRDRRGPPLPILLTASRLRALLAASPAASLAKPLAEALVTTSPATASPRMPVDQIYESALRGTVQIIVAR